MKQNAKQGRNHQNKTGSNRLRHKTVPLISEEVDISFQQQLLQIIYNPDAAGSAEASGAAEAGGFVNTFIFCFFAQRGGVMSEADPCLPRASVSQDAARCHRKAGAL